MPKLHECDVSRLHPTQITVGMIEEDYALLPLGIFWQQMDARRWVHPIDEYGRRRGFEHIPACLRDLVDDPYRSLAGYVRDAGGYQKSDSAFAEFAWADFYRHR